MRSLLPVRSRLMAEAEAISFVDALHERVDDILDSCTRCGKCVIACPMVEPARIDTGPKGAAAPAIVGGILDLLAGGEGTADARRWAEVCTNSGKCIPACDYGVKDRKSTRLNSSHSQNSYAV